MTNTTTENDFVNEKRITIVKRYVMLKDFNQN